MFCLHRTSVPRHNYGLVIIVVAVIVFNGVVALVAVVVAGLVIVVAVVVVAVIVGVVALVAVVVIVTYGRVAADFLSNPQLLLEKILAAVVFTIINNSC